VSTIPSAPTWRRLKTSLVACREKLEALKKERATISEMMEELEMKKISSRDNIAAAEEKIASSHSEMEKIDETVKVLVTEAAAIEKERSERREVINSEI